MAMVVACKQNDPANADKTGDHQGFRVSFVSLIPGAGGGVVGAVLALSFSNSNLSRSILVRS
jgi:hypothetical protein